MGSLLTDSKTLLAAWSTLKKSPSLSVAIAILAPLVAVLQDLQDLLVPPVTPPAPIPAPKAALPDLVALAEASEPFTETELAELPDAHLVGGPIDLILVAKILATIATNAPEIWAVIRSLIGKASA